jgi:hypothetical protein
VIVTHAGGTIFECAGWVDKLATASTADRDASSALLDRRLTRPTEGTEELT